MTIIEDDMTRLQLRRIADVAVWLGALELFAAGLFASGMAVELYNEIDDASYRLREVSLVLGEALVGTAVALVVLAGGRNTGGIVGA